MKHKIMAVMAPREGETRLAGQVEMDHVYLGGRRSGGKRGRGAAGKTPFVAAASTTPEGRPRQLMLARVRGFRKREIERGAPRWLAPGAAVVTDGLGCWNALDEAACSHRAIYLHEIADGFQARRLIGDWVRFHNLERPHLALDGRTLAEVYRGESPVDMMDKPLRTLPTSPQVQQQQQEDRMKGILAAGETIGIHLSPSLTEHYALSNLG